jgi:hypothetical protein
MELKNYNQASDLARRIREETSYIGSLNGIKPDSEHLQKLQPFKSAELKEAFDELGVTRFNPIGLESRITYYGQNLYKLKNIIPNHTKIQLAFLPADINGHLYSDQEIANGDNCILFFSEPDSALSYGLGGTAFSYHAKLLPPELQEQCSFVFDYISTTQEAEQKDLDLLKEKLFKAFSNWQKILQ